MTGHETPCPKCFAPVKTTDHQMFKGFRCKACGYLFQKNTEFVSVFKDAAVELDHVLVAHGLELCDNVDKVKVCAFLNDMIENSFYYDDYNDAETHAAVSEALRIFQTIKGGEHENQTEN